MTEHTPTDMDKLASRRPRRLTARDALRRDWFLQSLEWHLEGIVSGRERREIVRTIREDLAADERPMSIALDDLGSPRTLARRYADDESSPRPTWSIGIIWGGAAHLAYWFTFAVYTFGMLSVVAQSSLTEAHSRFFLADVLAFANDDGIGIGWTGDAAVILMPAAVDAVAVLLGARAWRALPSRRAQR